MNIITLPNQRQISIGTYARAWRHILTLQSNVMLDGFDYFAEPAHRILQSMRAGLQDRINKRGKVVPVELTERRMFTKVRKAAIRGAIVYTCRECGTDLDPLRVNPNNRESRFCSPECRRSHS